MHQNYYFLRQLAPSLRSELVGLKLMECFSQEKDELILVFAQARGRLNFYRPFFIQTTLRADFGCLSLPAVFSRARQNSVDLFTELNDLAVINVKSFENERALCIELEGEYTLVFKLFGNRPNVVLFHRQEVISVFNNKLQADNNLILRQLDRYIVQDFDAYQAANFNHQKLFPTFGKVVNTELEKRLEGIADHQQKWQVIENMVRQLENPTYYLTIWEYRLCLSLLEVGQVQRTYNNPMGALDGFYVAYQKQDAIEKEKGEALRALQKQITRLQTYIDDTARKLIMLEKATKNEEIGHILMANLHQIPERAERVELFDFYGNTTILIKLKPDLNPQRNAENYYRKAKNERIEKDKLEGIITEKRVELKILESHFFNIETFERVKELRKYIKNNSFAGNETATASPKQLFRQELCEGFVILIGRNAKNNDILTKQYAHKDDLWLHARDVSGSHVVIKNKSGIKFPVMVIERAAQIAAWHSKRRNDSLCPVIVTPKKFVRKPKGLAAGEVIIDKEEVVLVVPAP